jgi:HEPN domain-containing protein
LSFEGAEILRERALVFLKNAEYLIGQGDYDIGAFNIEQYCQLMVKYKLLLNVGAYPRTHSLMALLEELSKISTKVADLLNDGNKVIYISKIEDAYIGSRYLARRYSAVEVNEMLRFVKEVLRDVIEGV